MVNRKIGKLVKNTDFSPTAQLLYSCLLYYYFFFFQITREGFKSLAKGCTRLNTILLNELPSLTDESIEVSETYKLEDDLLGN